MQRIGMCTTYFQNNKNIRLLVVILTIMIVLLQFVSNNAVATDTVLVAVDAIADDATAANADVVDATAATTTADTANADVVTDTAADTNEGSKQSFLQNVKTIVDILPIILSGVGMLMGYGYVRSLREKTITAVFTYWSQLTVRLIQLRERLLFNVGLINNLFSPEERKIFEENEPTNEEVTSLYNMINEILKFLKTSEDQMPAYTGWHNDYVELVISLSELIQYDIRKPNKYFVTVGTNALDERNKRCRQIVVTIDKLINAINERQDAAEKRMYRFVNIWSSIKSWIREKRSKQLQAEEIHTKEA